MRSGDIADVLNFNVGKSIKNIQKQINRIGMRDPSSGLSKFFTKKKRNTKGKSEGDAKGLLSEEGLKDLQEKAEGDDVDLGDLNQSKSKSVFSLGANYDKLSSEEKEII